MRKYQVKVEGRNFLIDIDGRLIKHGFFTTRFVEAADPASAETEAVQKMRRTQWLRDLVRNDPDDPPTLHIHEITEVDSFDGIGDVEAGATWYAEDEERDDDE